MPLEPFPYHAKHVQTGRVVVVSSWNDGQTALKAEYEDTGEEVLITPFFLEQWYVLTGPDQYGFDASLTTTTPDNPFWDGTDGAHPAWWRGNDQGAIVTAQKLQLIAETGEHKGTFGGVEIEAAAQAIMKVHQAKGVFQKGYYSKIEERNELEVANKRKDDLLRKVLDNGAYFGGGAFEVKCSECERTKEEGHRDNCLTGEIERELCSSKPIQDSTNDAPSQ